MQRPGRRAPGRGPSPSETRTSRATRPSAVTAAGLISISSSSSGTSGGEAEEALDGLDHPVERQARRLPAQGRRREADGRRPRQGRAEAVAAVQRRRDDRDLAARAAGPPTSASVTIPPAPTLTTGPKSSVHRSESSSSPPGPGVVVDELGDREALHGVAQARPHRLDGRGDGRAVVRDDGDAADLGLVDDPAGDDLDDDPVARAGPRGAAEGSWRRAAGIGAGHEAPARDRDPGRRQDREALRLEQRRPAGGAGALEDRADAREAGAGVGARASASGASSGVVIATGCATRARACTAFAPGVPGP